MLAASAAAQEDTPSLMLAERASLNIALGADRHSMK
jgi:hypothetical protein